MSTLEKQALRAWRAWGGYAKTTRCDECGEQRYCRSVRGRVWVCMTCWDLLPEARRERRHGDGGT